MKTKESAESPGSKHLESEGSASMAPPAFSLSASPVDPPSDAGDALQFKRGGDAPGGPGGDAGAGGGSIAGLLGQMGSSMGADFSGVKINTNSAQASKMGALAFAKGDELHFAPGQYDPSSQDGRALIGHELAHVVQQREGRVQATGMEQGNAVNTDHTLESEADALGAKAAAQMKLAGGESTASVGSYGGSGTVQKAEDPKAPQLEAYKGAPVGKPGRISAPAADYATAISSGVKVRPKPDFSLEPIGRLRYNTLVHVVALDKSGGYCFVAGAGTAGWINRNYVAMDMPEAQADLHHVTEPDLTTILKQHYIDGGRWSISTGNDYTTLAAAVVSANSGRMGVSVDWAKAQAWKDEHSVRATLDPWMIDTRSIYQASKVVAGSNIWLPSASHVRMLQATGAVGSRPDWVNGAVEVGKGLGGFTVGLQVGIYGDLWDMLTGLWDMGKMVVDTIKGLLDGSLFTAVGEIFDALDQMTPEKALEMVKAVLNSAKAAGEDFISNWKNGNPFDRWFFRGKILGTIVTEVVLAILTAGTSLGELVVLKLGKYFPKLAGILGKLLKLGDKLPGLGGKKHKPDADMPDGKPRHLPDLNDSDALDWKTKLGFAQAVSEMHDTVDTPIAVLIATLNTTIAAKSDAVTGYKAVQTGPGTYDIIQYAKHKPETAKKGYTTGKKEAGIEWDVDLANEVSRIFREADEYLDCSDIASSLKRWYPGGYVLEIKPKSGKWMKGLSYGKADEFVFHHAYVKGKYTYDPMFGEEPMLTSEYLQSFNQMNPEGLKLEKL